MPTVARHNDTAGGAISATATTVFVNGLPVARIGDAVAGHGDDEHAGPTMAEGSTTVFAEGIGVCRLGDAASCGHTVSVASLNVNAG